MRGAGGKIFSGRFSRAERARRRQSIVLDDALTPLRTNGFQKDTGGTVKAKMLLFLHV